LLSVLASPAYAHDDTATAGNGVGRGGERIESRKAQPKGARTVAPAANAASAAGAQDQFKDGDGKHWAYDAVTELEAKGILKGYPAGSSHGKRAMTRDEFVVALQRALDSIHPIPGPAGPAGPAGPQGPAGPAGPSGVSAEQRAAILAFQTEMQK